MLRFFSLILFVSSPLLADEARKGEKFYEKKEFKKAEEAFLSAEIDEPDNQKHSYNRGVASLATKNFEGAIEAFTKSSNSSDGEIKKKSFFNLGHAQYGKGDLEPSLESFKKFLELEPESKEAKENIEWVEKQIEKQKKQEKENQDKKDQDKKDQDKKDQDKKDQDKKDQDKKDQDKKDQDKKDQDKKDQDKKDQDKKDQDKKDQDKKDQDKKDQDKKDQDKKDQDKKDQDKKDQDKQDQKSEEEKEKSEEQKDSSESKEDEEQSSSGEEKEKQISKEEMERLLRSIENMEKVYGVPPKVPKNSKKPKKDW